jgi:CrcB protein
MTILELTIVGAGGFFGAVLRYLVSTTLNRQSKIPLGTLIVNLSGALFIGLVIGMELSRLWTFFLISGLAGAFTTFSTLNKEVLELWKVNKKKEAVFYVVITFGVGISFALIGYIISSK